MNDLTQYYLLYNVMNKLSHKTQLPDWHLCQLTDEPLHAGLAVDGERVGHDVVEPAEQVRLEQKNWSRWKQTNEIIENNTWKLYCLNTSNRLDAQVQRFS